MQTSRQNIIVGQRHIEGSLLGSEALRIPPFTVVRIVRATKVLHPVDVPRALVIGGWISLSRLLPHPEDGRGVLIYLTEFGKEKRAYSRERVITFNETIREQISEEKMNHFYEVADLINNMISNKKIYNSNDKVF